MSSSNSGGGGVKISSTFLDVLRARAAASTSSSSRTMIEYPPAPTPRAAAPAIFLSGGASPAALAAKLDLFAYCLADAGEEFFLLFEVFFFRFSFDFEPFSLVFSQKKNKQQKQEAPPRCLPWARASALRARPSPGGGWRSCSTTRSRITVLTTLLLLLLRSTPRSGQSPPRPLPTRPTSLEKRSWP